MAVSDKVAGFVAAVGGEPRFALSDADAVTLVSEVGVASLAALDSGGRIPFADAHAAFLPLATGAPPADVQALVQFVSEYQSKAADFWQAFADALVLGARIVRKQA